MMNPNQLPPEQLMPPSIGPGQYAMNFLARMGGQLNGQPGWLSRGVASGLAGIQSDRQAQQQAAMQNYRMQQDFLTRSRMYGNDVASTLGYSPSQDMVKELQQGMGNINYQNMAGNYINNQLGTNPQMTKSDWGQTVNPAFTNIEGTNQLLGTGAFTQREQNIGQMNLETQKNAMKVQNDLASTQGAVELAKTLGYLGEDQAKSLLENLKAGTDPAVINDLLKLQVQYAIEALQGDNAKRVKETPSQSTSIIKRDLPPPTPGQAYVQTSRELELLRKSKANAEAIRQKEEELGRLMKVLPGKKEDPLEAFLKNSITGGGKKTKRKAPRPKGNPNG